MRVTRVEIHDVRSVTGASVWLDLSGGTTTLVGPNHAGKSNVVRAAAMALDPTITWSAERDRPFKRPKAEPRVIAEFTSGARLEVRWNGDDREEEASGAHDRDGLCPPGCTVVVETSDRLDDVFSREAELFDLDEDDLNDLGLRFAREARLLVPDIGSVRVFRSGPKVRVEVEDRLGYRIGERSGLRGAAAVAVAEQRSDAGRPLRLVAVEEPEAFLHPAAQEALRDRFDRLGRTLDVAVVVTTESPFMVSRDDASRVIALVRDEHGRTVVIGASWGNEPHAPLLGGLFRDPGLASILDRSALLPTGVAGVVIFEGGTDEAYLRMAADLLGRGALLEELAISAAGGASSAALKAIVLRAETDTPLFVILDNDQPGKKAKETLVGRFGFKNRAQVTSYAEIFESHPDGTEAEDLFDWRLVERFVQEFGDGAIRGKRILYDDAWHFDLTSEAKSAFVSWLRDNAAVEHVDGWARLLDIIAERLGVDA